MKNFISNVLPWIIGFVIGAFILWKVLIKPTIDVITLEGVITFAILIIVLLVVCRVADNMLKEHFKE